MLTVVQSSSLKIQNGLVVLREDSLMFHGSKVPNKQIFPVQNAVVKPQKYFHFVVSQRLLPMDFRRIEIRCELIHETDVKTHADTKYGILQITFFPSVMFPTWFSFEFFSLELEEYLQNLSLNRRKVKHTRLESPAISYSSMLQSISSCTISCGSLVLILLVLHFDWF